MGALRHEGTMSGAPAGDLDGQVRSRPLRAHLGSRECPAGQAMSPYLWLSVWFFMLASSVAAHEAGHLLVGRRYGWDYAGFAMKLTGPKVLIGPPRQDGRTGTSAESRWPDRSPRL